MEISRELGFALRFGDLNRHQVGDPRTKILIYEVVYTFKEHTCTYNMFPAATTSYQKKFMKNQIESLIKHQSDILNYCLSSGRPGASNSQESCI